MNQSYKKLKQNIAEYALGACWNHSLKFFDWIETAILLFFFGLFIVTK